MYNVNHDLAPDNFEGMFVSNNIIPYHDTIISDHLHPTTTSRNISQNSIRYRSVII